MTIAQDSFMETKGNVILSLVVLRQLYSSLILRSLSSQETREQNDPSNTQASVLAKYKIIHLFSFISQFSFP